MYEYALKVLLKLYAIDFCTKNDSLIFDKKFVNIHMTVLSFADTSAI